MEVIERPILDSKELFLRLVEVNRELGDWGNANDPKYSDIPNLFFYWKVETELGTVFPCISDEVATTVILQFMFDGPKWFKLTRLIPSYSIIADRYLRWRNLNGYDATKGQPHLVYMCDRVNGCHKVGKTSGEHRNKDSDTPLPARRFKRGKESGNSQSPKRVSRARESRK